MLASRDWEFWFKQKIRQFGVVGTYVRERRQHYKLSQTRLAKELNVCQDIISKMECGKYLPTKNMRVRLAEFFQCSEALFEDM